MDSFQELGQECIAYTKAKGRGLVVAFKGDNAKPAIANAWLDYWAVKGFGKAVKLFERHLLDGKEITVPCDDPARFDVDYHPQQRKPRNWHQPQHIERSPAERRAIANQIRAKMGLPIVEY